MSVRPVSVRLRPMTSEQYDAWLPPMLEDYAAETAQSRLMSIEEGRQEARRQLDELLPDGCDTPDHHLLVAYDGDEQVGSLWLRIRDEHRRRRAFVFFVEVDEARRGRGYGREIMLAGEEYARADGASAMALNVFGPNEAARALYDKMGYEVTNLTMQKTLEAGTRHAQVDQVDRQ
jgi:ribosomal protein S18 acetylase RimI-like enzyme